MKVYLERIKKETIKFQIILATGRGILADLWVPHDIEHCNFQNLLVFGFPETSQNLILFRQLLFSLFQSKVNSFSVMYPEISQSDFRSVCKNLSAEILQLLLTNILDTNILTEYEIKGINDVPDTNQKFNCLFTAATTTTTTAVTTTTTTSKNFYK